MAAAARIVMFLCRQKDLLLLFTFSVASHSFVQLKSRHDKLRSGPAAGAEASLRCIHYVIPAFFPAAANTGLRFSHGRFILPLSSHCDLPLRRQQDLFYVAAPDGNRIRVVVGMKPNSNLYHIAQDGHDIVGRVSIGAQLDKPLIFAQLLLRFPSEQSLGNPAPFWRE